jgi:hypothetical protein
MRPNLAELAHFCTAFRGGLSEAVKHAPEMLTFAASESTSILRVRTVVSGSVIDLLLLCMLSCPITCLRHLCFAIIFRAFHINTGYLLRCKYDARSPCLPDTFMLSHGHSLRSFHLLYMGASKAGTPIRSSIHRKSSLMKWIIYDSHVSKPLNTTCLSNIKHSKVFGELMSIIFSCVLRIGTAE